MARLKITSTRMADCGEQEQIVQLLLQVFTDSSCMRVEGTVDGSERQLKETHG